jgi:hypothetical protein
MTEHLVALHTRLSHERGYLAKAKTASERELRSVWISQIEKEITAERVFLGMPPDEPLEDVSDDELLAALLDEPA